MNPPPLFFTENLDNWWSRISLYDPGWIMGFWLVSAFLFGSCIGSFLNVCIWRIPRGESICDAPSHCPKCGTRLRWYDNVPVWGYLSLRGRCRYCAEPISPRYLGMELLLGALFTAMLAKVGWSEEPPAKLLAFGPMIMLIVTTFFIDRKYRLIPDLTTYPAMIWGVGVSCLLPSVWGVWSWWLGGAWSLGSLAVCGGVLAVFALAGRRLAGRDVLGWGDVKYMMAAGALLGLYGAFFTLLAGSLLGTLYGAALALRRGRKFRGLALAFGPFLAIGSLVWIFGGERLLRLYLAWTSF